MGSLFIDPFQQATNANGASVAGAMQYFYVTGTSTPTPVYTTGDLSVEHSNPVIANAAGRFAAIYLDSNVTYRVVLKDALGTVIQDIDPYSPGGSANINTGKGSISPRDRGALGGASVETGLGPDETGPVQEAFDIALRDGLVVDELEKYKFAIGEVWAGAPADRLNLGRGVDLTAKHGLMYPGKSGRDYNPASYSATPGTQPFAENPQGFTFGHIMIDAAYGLSQGLTILGGEDCRIGLFEAKQFGNPASNALVFGTNYACARNTAGMVLDFGKFDCEPAAGFSIYGYGASSGMLMYGVTPNDMGILGAVAYHRIHGGTVPTNPYWCEDAKVNVQIVGGDYGLTFAGACRNSTALGSALKQVRNVVSQNNNESLTINMDAGEWISVAFLANFFNRKHKITIRTEGSSLVAGAAPVDIGFSSQDLVIIDSKLGAFTSPNGTPKAAIRIANDAERVTIKNTDIFGTFQMAGILMQSGASSLPVGTNGLPPNTGTNEFDPGRGQTAGNGDFDNQGHVPSSVTEISGIRFNISNAVPLMAFYQIGTQKLSVGKIAGCSTSNKNYTKAIVGFMGDLGTPIILNEFTGNYPLGVGAVDYDFSAFNVIKREANGGDPGSSALPVVSKGSAPSPFPAGNQAFFLDITGGPATATADGRTWRVAGAAITTASTFTSGTNVNTTRTENVIDKTGGAAGYTAALGSSASIAATDDPEAVIIYRPGSDSAISFTAAATAPSPLIANSSAAIQIAAGRLVQWSLGAVIGELIDIGVTVGQQVSVAFRRSRGSIETTVDNLVSSEVPATLSAGNPTWVAFPILAVGTDVPIAPGIRRIPIAGKPVNTVYPTITVASHVATAAIGTWTDATTLTLQFLQNGSNYGTPQIIRDGLGGADATPATVATVTGQFYSIRVTATSSVAARTAKTMVTTGQVAG